MSTYHETDEADDGAAATTAPRLPRAATVEAFDAVVDDEQRLRPGVEALCRTLELDATALHRFEDRFPPPYAHEQPDHARPRRPTSTGAHR